MKKIILLTTFIFQFIYVICYSQQSNIDSLLLCLKNSNSDTLRCEILNELIANESSDNVWPKYNKQLEIISNKNIFKSKGELKKLFYSYYALSLNNFGYLYKQQGNISKAYFYFNKSLKIQRIIKDKIGIASSLMNLGMILRQQGNVAKALDYYHNSLKINLEIDNKQGVAASYNNIGYVYDSQGEYEKALEYYNKSLNINYDINDKSGIAYCYLNIAYLYKSQGAMFFKGTKEECIKKGQLKAIDFLNKAIEIQTSINDLTGLISSYNSLGDIYDYFGDPLCNSTSEICKKQGQFKALDYYFKSLSLSNEIQNKLGVANSLSSIAEIKYQQNLIDEAFDYAARCLNTATELGYPENIKDAALLLKKIYEKQGNYNKALESYELYVQMKDSLLNQENRKSTLKKQFQIEYEILATKDSITNVTKRKEEQLKHEQAIHQQRIYTFGGFSGFILMLIIAAVSYIAFKNKKKANRLLEQKNAEINQQKEEISTQRDEITAQRDLVTEQKEHIEEIHKEVTDSINYAKRIQEAVLPISDVSRSVLGEHFILFKPKDIVSGDFYWTTKINNWLIVAVADCTGHGVPGAFMSMLGISFLNEIVQKQEVNKANQILNYLRIEIVNALQQKGTQGGQKDGMDISLIVINIETNECQWAGANNPLYIVTQFGNENQFENLKMNQFENKKGENIDNVPPLSNYQINEFSNLIELKGDKMPIAIYPKMNDFTNHEFILQKGDLLYLFSDGFADQFGGTKGKKFMYKQFKELLITNCNLPMLKQREILEKSIKNWMVGNEQIDDITVLGLKI